MENCFFCNELKSNNLKNIIIENKEAIAICESYFREGHCTIILKEHKKSISELNENEYNAIFSLIKIISKALEKKYDTEKTYLLSIGDQVEHLHFHLIPKHKNKCSMGVYCFGKLFESEGENKPSEMELNNLTEEIKILIKNG